MGDYLTQDIVYFNAFYGEEQVFKFKAAYTDELLLTVGQVTEYQIAIVEIKDSLVAHCFDSSGTAVLLDYSLDSIRTISLGQVEAGHTYYLIFDRTQEDTLHFTLNLHCPDLCTTPRQLQVEHIGPNTAQLHWQNNSLTAQWSIELRPQDMPFNGLPTHSGSGSTVEINSLQPLSLYHWRIRAICFDTLIGDWSIPGTFATGPVCANMTDLACGQQPTLLFPGGPELRTGCDAANQAGFHGPEVYARFTPTYDGFYQLRFIPDNAWIELGLSIATVDSACRMSDWRCGGRFGDLLAVGLLRADSTYVFAFEFNDVWNYAGQTFRIMPECPIVCAVPDSLYATDLTHQSAVVGWKAQLNQTQWEVELLIISPSATFDDTLYLLTNTPYLQINDLLRGSSYRWRVRGSCGGFGYGAWTGDRQFLLPPNCTAGNASLPLKISRLTGEVLQVESWEMRSGMNARTIEMGRFPPGIYWLTLQTNEGQVRTTKVIKL